MSAMSAKDSTPSPITAALVLWENVTSASSTATCAEPARTPVTTDLSILTKSGRIVASRSSR